MYTYTEVDKKWMCVFHKFLYYGYHDRHLLVPPASLARNIFNPTTVTKSTRCDSKPPISHILGFWCFSLWQSTLRIARYSCATIQSQKTWSRVCVRVCCILVEFYTYVLCSYTVSPRSFYVINDTDLISFLSIIRYFTNYLPKGLWKCRISWLFRYLNLIIYMQFISMLEAEKLDRVYNFANVIFAMITPATKCVICG